MADLLVQVEQFIRRHELLRPGATVVVGVSGGPDSLCLLHLLRRLAPGWELRLHVAHLNHGLRGAESDADAAFVAALAEAWGLPWTVGRADVATLAAQPGASLEEAARQARYRFLVDVAEAAGATRVAAGHHADDQAETVLLHLLRGSGLAGLRGMLPLAELAQQTLLLIRPLLCATRAEILAYCAEQGLAPRLDSSNADTSLLRNRLRHELLPILAGYNPAIRRELAQTAELVAGDYAVLAEVVQDAWQSVLRAAERDQICLDRAAWQDLPLGLQRATLRRAIHVLRQGLRNVGWEHVERAVWLAREGHTGQVATLTAGLALEIGYDRLRVGPEGQTWPLDQFPQVAAAQVLAAPGVTHLAQGWTVTVQRAGHVETAAGRVAESAPQAAVEVGRNADASEESRPPNAPAANSWLAWLDVAATGPILTLRPRRPGDRFQPQGMGGHSSSLKEFMIDAKVPRSARSGWPVLQGAFGGIAWVCGLRVAEWSVVRGDSRASWRVEFHPPQTADS